MIELKPIGKSNKYIKAYAIEMGDKSIPTVRKAAVTADLRKASQRNKESKTS